MFRSGAEPGGGADVDVFDEFLSGEVFLCGGGFERIEINNHQVDWRDAVFSGLFLVFGEIAAKEEAAVDFGMERLHPAAEHFWPASELGNIPDGNTSFTEGLCGAALASSFHAQ